MTNKGAGMTNKGAGMTIVMLMLMLMTIGFPRAQG